MKCCHVCEIKIIYTLTRLEMELYVISVPFLFSLLQGPCLGRNQYPAPGQNPPLILVYGDVCYGYQCYSGWYQSIGKILIYRIYPKYPKILILRTEIWGENTVNIVWIFKYSNIVKMSLSDRSHITTISHLL